jgi:hypothetical protein
MDSDEEIEQFYKNWLSINRPQSQGSSTELQTEQNEEIDDLSHIVYENNTFQLYVEKGKKILIQFITS